MKKKFKQEPILNPFLLLDKFIPLLSFERNKDITEIEEAKKNLNNAIEYFEENKQLFNNTKRFTKSVFIKVKHLDENEALAPIINKINFAINKLSIYDDIVDNHFETMMAHTVFIIVAEYIEILLEFKLPSMDATKNVKSFKDKNVYLDSYINSFSTTQYFYKQMGNDILVQELEDTLEIFKGVRDGNKKIIQKLFGSYLLHTEYTKYSTQLQIKIFHNDYSKYEKHTKIYNNFFDGYNISEQDIYRSLFIRLYYIYNFFGDNKGRGDKNPNNYIEDLMLALSGKSMKLDTKKMKNVYIKSYYYGIPIFDYKDNNKDNFDIFEYYLENTEIKDKSTDGICNSTLRNLNPSYFEKISKTEHSPF